MQKKGKPVKLKQRSLRRRSHDNCFEELNVAEYPNPSR